MSAYKERCDYTEEKHSRPKVLVCTGAGRGRGVADLTKLQG
jgi:hypothetical protein